MRGRQSQVSGIKWWSSLNSRLRNTYFIRNGKFLEVYHHHQENGLIKIKILGILTWWCYGGWTRKSLVDMRKAWSVCDRKRWASVSTEGRADTSWRPKGTESTMTLSSKVPDTVHPISAKAVFILGYAPSFLSHNSQTLFPSKLEYSCKTEVQVISGVFYISSLNSRWPFPHLKLHGVYLPTLLPAFLTCLSLHPDPGWLLSLKWSAQEVLKSFRKKGWAQKG